MLSQQAHGLGAPVQGGGVGLALAGAGRGLPQGGELGVPGSAQDAQVLGGVAEAHGVHVRRHGDAGLSAEGAGRTGGVPPSGALVDPGVIVQEGDGAVHGIGYALVASQEIVPAEGIDEYGGDEPGLAHVLVRGAEAVPRVEFVQPAAADGILSFQSPIDDVPHGHEEALIVVELVHPGHGQQGPTRGAPEVRVIDAEGVDAVLHEPGQVIADAGHRLLDERVAGQEVVAHHSLGPDVTQVEGVEAEIRGR